MEDVSISGTPSSSQCPQSASFSSTVTTGTSLSRSTEGSSIQEEMEKSDGGSTSQEEMEQSSTLQSLPDLENLHIDLLDEKVELLIMLLLQRLDKIQ